MYSSRSVTTSQTGTVPRNDSCRDLPDIFFFPLIEHIVTSYRPLAAYGLNTEHLFNSAEKVFGQFRSFSATN